MITRKLRANPPLSHPFPHVKVFPHVFLEALQSFRVLQPGRKPVDFTEEEEVEEISIKFRALSDVQGFPLGVLVSP